MRVTYSSVKVEIDRATRRATITILGPDDRRRPPRPRPCTSRAPQFWPLRLARELDDAILHLRLNEPEIGVLIFKSAGRCRRRCWPTTRSSRPTSDHWLAREILHYWKRVLKRIDLTSRSLVALIEPGSCFAGTLAEIVFACDRSFMLIGTLAGRQPRRRPRSRCRRSTSAPTR